MEKQVKIRTPDKKTIYGLLNWRKKTDSLVIFVHGLTGHPNEHHLYNGSRFLTGKGYATFRFNLYSAEPDARKWKTVTLKDHSRDLETVIKHFAKRYKHIHLIGHSLGGPSILLADLKNVSSIVLWDPSENIGKSLPGWTAYNRKLDAYIIEWETDIIMNKRFYEELRALPSMVPIAQGLKVPMRVILAGQGLLKKRWKDYGETITIAGAGHTFDEEGAEEQLFKETFDWIKRF